MSWPSSPLTSYVASSLPAIKAADLNSIQQAINKIILGTYSIYGLKIDGVGGVDVSGTPPAAGSINCTQNCNVTGNLQVTGVGGVRSTIGGPGVDVGQLTASGNLYSSGSTVTANTYLASQTQASGTSAPTTSVAEGSLSMDGIPIGWAIGTATGTLTRGFNVKSIGRSSGHATGWYDIVFNVQGPNTAVAFVTPVLATGANGAQAIIVSVGTDGSGGQTIRVALFNQAGTLTDTAFMVIAYPG